MMDTFNSLIKNRNKKPFWSVINTKRLALAYYKKNLQLSIVTLLLNVEVKLGDLNGLLVKAECEDRGVDSKWLILRIGAGGNRN